MWGEVVNTRSAKTLLAFAEPLINLVQKQTGYEVHYWRTDQVKEFKSESFQSFLRANKIEWESGTPFAYH